ncbi:unnamed protein product [Phytophthora lilii]|uniref:Unnamed protein product n=1 Tax=Phytophthora lilii TaxID=2077276 RepID=A0A9W6WSU7_9STRA|nr:unnamed protein product [Phytophthora lilii]
MVVATLAAVGCSLSHSWRTTSTRVGKILVTLGLAVVGFLSIGWAVVGLVSLPKHQYHVDTATLYDASCWNDIALVRAAHWSIAQLLAVGGLLLVTTLCCRLENFFLAPNAPKIDLTELSPTIAAMKTPERVEQSTRTEYVENISESV